jgi:hypothetical protein
LRSKKDPEDELRKNVRPLLNINFKEKLRSIIEVAVMLAVKFINHLIRGN